MIVAKQIGCELWVSVHKHYWFLVGHKITYKQYLVPLAWDSRDYGEKAAHKGTSCPC